MDSMFVYMALSPAWPVDRFKATIERILAETGLSQAALAALVPMDQSQLSRWKSGSSRPKFESLTALGDAIRARYPLLQIGPADLLEAAGYAAPGDEDSARERPLQVIDNPDREKSIEEEVGGWSRDPDAAAVEIAIAAVEHAPRQYRIDMIKAGRVLRAMREEDHRAAGRGS